MKQAFFYRKIKKYLTGAFKKRGQYIKIVNSIKTLHLGVPGGHKITMQHVVITPFEICLKDKEIFFLNIRKVLSFINEAAFTIKKEKVSALALKVHVFDEDSEYFALNNRGLITATVITKPNKITYGADEKNQNRDIPEIFRS